MTDFLIQRHIPNAPNENQGAWVDEGIARDLKADQAQQAVEQTASPDHPTATRRAIKWEHVTEFDTTPGTPKVSKREKDTP